MLSLHSSMRRSHPSLSFLLHKKACSMARIALVFVAFSVLARGTLSTTFNFKNNCPYTVWPATLSGENSPSLSKTGFELQNGASLSVDAPEKWSGRMWARQMCSNNSGKFACSSADCGTGEPECNGATGTPPATLVEFTLNGADGKDFYDVSLVDGFNVPVSITPQGGQGDCGATSCLMNVNARCPQELWYTEPTGGLVVGCKSPCLAFSEDRYCCNGKYNKPDRCTPSNYSEIFKKACPQAYSYPYDDASSTFTCTGANYVITFCVDI